MLIPRARGDAKAEERAREIRHPYTEKQKLMATNERYNHRTPPGAPDPLICKEIVTILCYDQARATAFLPDVLPAIVLYHIIQ